MQPTASPVLLKGHSRRPTADTSRTTARKSATRRVSLSATSEMLPGPTGALDAGGGLACVPIATVSSLSALLHIPDQSRRDHRDNSSKTDHFSNSPPCHLRAVGLVRLRGFTQSDQRQWERCLERAWVLRRCRLDGRRPSAAALYDLLRFSGRIELRRQTDTDGDLIRKVVAEGAVNLIVTASAPWDFVGRSSKRGRAAHRIIHAAQCLRHSSCPGIRLKKNVNTSIERSHWGASFGEPFLRISFCGLEGLKRRGLAYRGGD